MGKLYNKSGHREELKASKLKDASKTERTLSREFKIKACELVLKDGTKHKEDVKLKKFKKENERLKIEKPEFI